MPNRQTSFGEKMGDWFRYILSCCEEPEKVEEERPALQISGPTNFRREDISIPGLTPEQQAYIREKATSDAVKMWANLQPLRSSPSNHFASAANTLPTFEDFTVPRSSAATTSPASRRASGGGWERVKAHSRKISNSLTKPLGYQAVHTGPDQQMKGTDLDDSRYEMRALMDPSAVHVVPAGKLSGDSFSGDGEGSDRDDRDSGKGMSKI